MVREVAAGCWVVWRAPLYVLQRIMSQHCTSACADVTEVRKCPAMTNVPAVVRCWNRVHKHFEISPFESANLSDRMSSEPLKPVLAEASAHRGMSG